MADAPPIRIALTEDNDFLARSLEEKLGLFGPEVAFCFHARNGRDLLERLRTAPGVDVVLMDIEMPVMDGIAATEEVHRRYPRMKVLMLTVFDDDDKIFRAIQAGAMGYLLKDEPPGKLLEAVRMIMEGGAPMSASIAAKTLQLLRDPSRARLQGEAGDVQLTKREIEILQCLKRGLDYKAIAEDLFIAPATVRKHIENIYQKLQAHNKMEAVQTAVRHRLID